MTAAFLVAHSLASSLLPSSYCTKSHILPCSTCRELVSPMYVRHADYPLAALALTDLQRKALGNQSMNSAWERGDSSSWGAGHVCPAVELQAMRGDV